MRTATGREIAPRTMDIAHWVKLRRSVDRALEPKQTISTWPPMVIKFMPRKKGLRLMPSKMLNLSSRRRLLIRCKREGSMNNLEQRLTSVG